MTEAILAAGDQPLTCKIIRDGKEMTLSVKPVMIEADLPRLVLTLSRKAGDVLDQGLQYPVSVFRTHCPGNRHAPGRQNSASGTASRAPSPS